MILLHIGYDVLGDSLQMLHAFDERIRIPQVFGQRILGAVDGLIILFDLLLDGSSCLFPPLFGGTALLFRILCRIAVSRFFGRRHAALQSAAFISRHLSRHFCLRSRRRGALLQRLIFLQKIFLQLGKRILFPCSFFVPFQIFLIQIFGCV